MNTAPSRVLLHSSLFNGHAHWQIQDLRMGGGDYGERVPITGVTARSVGPIYGPWGWRPPRSASGHTSTSTVQMRTRAWSKRNRGPSDFNHRSSRTTVFTFQGRTKSHPTSGFEMPNNSISPRSRCRFKFSQHSLVLAATIYFVLTEPVLSHDLHATSIRLNPQYCSSTLICVCTRLSPHATIT
jgi:hypothetical protein